MLDKKEAIDFAAFIAVTLMMVVSLATIARAAGPPDISSLLPSPTLVQGDKHGETLVDGLAPKETVQEMIVRLANEYGVDPDDAERISFCESSHNPLAENYSNKNGSNDKGLFQINSTHGVPDSCRLDAECNIEWAMEMINKKGYQPWHSSKNCWDGG